MKSAFFVVLVFASKWHSGTTTCTDEDISNCARPLAAFNLTTAPIIPTRTEQEMRDLCSAYNIVEKCLGGIERHCDYKQRLKMRTIDNQYDYICDQTFEEYLEHRECLATPELHSDANKCNETLTEHFSSIQKLNRSASFKRDRLCQYTNQYINCIHVTVRGYCSEEAANWQRNLDALTALPAFSSINCTIYNHNNRHTKKSRPPVAATASDGNETTMIVVAVIVVGVACLVLAGGMTAFFIHRKRKADQKRAALEMLNMTRREPGQQRASRPSRSYENPVVEGAEASNPPSTDFLPPPYLEKDVPPPCYRHPPNYDAVFANSAGATGLSLTTEVSFPKEKV